MVDLCALLSPLLSERTWESVRLLVFFAKEIKFQVATACPFLVEFVKLLSYRHPVQNYSSEVSSDIVKWKGYVKMLKYSAARDRDGIWRYHKFQL